MEGTDSGSLIRGLLSGDAEVIELLRTWIRSASGPYRTQLVGELEDVEQETLLDLTDSIRKGRFRHQCTFHTYVRTFVHHKCIDRLRARSRRTWIDIDGLDLPAPAPTALDRLSKAETADLALRVFAEMPERCRELWKMLFEGKSYQEMSQSLGLAEGALRLRVFRCRKRAVEARARLLTKKLGNKI